MELLANGPKPDPLVGILENRDALRRLLDRLRQIRMPADKLGRGTRAADPQRPVTRLVQRPHIHARLNPSLVRQMREAGVRIVMPERAILYPKPKAALLGNAKRRNLLVEKVRVLGQMEHAEFNAIEPDQALLRAQPEKAIFSLANGVNPIGRKTILTRPRPAGILRQSSRRIQSKNAAGQEAQQETSRQGHRPEPILTHNSVPSGTANSLSTGCRFC